MKIFRLLRCAFGISFAEEFAYKGNFIIKSIASLFWDFVGPLVVLLIYRSSSGIPGWSFEEFLLFQGTFTLVFGVAQMLFYDLAYVVLYMIRRGKFDFILTKPANTLLYLATTNVNIDMLAKIFVGLFLIIYSVIKLHISLISINAILYLFVISLGLAAQFGFIVLVCALGLLFVNSFALMDLLFKLSDFVRYPLSVYNAGLQVTFTFLLPLAVSSFYPAEVLLRGTTLSSLIYVTLPVIGFLVLSVWLWSIGLKKYTSAGG